jgi:hypothetical protein
MQIQPPYVEDKVTLDKHAFLYLSDIDENVSKISSKWERDDDNLPLESLIFILFSSL